MIVFTAPIREGQKTIGTKKVFVSPREIKMFEVAKYFGNSPNVLVQIGHAFYIIPYSSMEKAEKYVREAIDAIMDDIDYEFPMYEVK